MRIVIYPTNAVWMYFEEDGMLFDKRLNWREADFQRAGIPMEREITSKNEGGKVWKSYLDRGHIWVIFPTKEKVTNRKTWKSGSSRKVMFIDGVRYLECSRCSVVRKEDAFSGDVKSPHGKMSYCKLCRAELRNAKKAHSQREKPDPKQGKSD